MLKLTQIEEAMRPNFIFDREGLKPLQLDEEIEGSKDLARTIFVGIADMNGHQHSDVMAFLEMGYDSYRTKIQQFRQHWRDAHRRVDEGTQYLIEDPVKKFYVKTGLTLNYIRWKYNSEYVNLQVNYE